MALGEASENPFGQLDRRRADRDRAARDGRLRAHFFRDVKGALKQLVQMPRSRAAAARRSVGFFHLTENLRLADDHGVQPAHDAEKMPDGARRGVPEKCFAFRGGSACRHEIAHGREPVLGVFRRHVEFHAIAGRDDHRFTEAGHSRKLCRDARQLAIGNGETLPHFDGRGVMTEAEADDLHMLQRPPF